MSPAGRIVVHVPLAIRPRSGRKTIVSPTGSRTSPSITAHADPAIVKALARAFRWKRLLESGRYISISEIAAAEKIDRGYVGNILRLTLLAPTIVEALIDGRHLPDLQLSTLMKPFSLTWSDQCASLLSQVPQQTNPITADTATHRIDQNGDMYVGVRR
jgi:hypothetical protein